MIGRLLWVARRVANRIWFRSALYGGGAVFALFLSAWAGPFVPEGLANRVNTESVRGLLNIMASSMLVVATFSLGTMVAAFTAAASGATPRATSILIDDPVSQNVLATFVGAFVFSIIGLVTLTMGLIGSGGRVVLLFATAVVICAVVGTLFGWLDYLANLVRIGVVMDKVEARAEAAIRTRAASPCLGGTPLAEPPEGAWPVAQASVGYVTHIDMSRLEEIAARVKGAIFVGCAPGSLVDPERPLAWTSWGADDPETAAIRSAFTVENERSVDQDPRYGLIVLSEIASRALSPGINDPGTAIAVIGRLQRLLTVSLLEGRETPSAPVHPHVHVRALRTEDLFADAFGPLARDGAPMVEVGVRLQKALGSLAALGGPDYGDAAQQQSQRALGQARAKLVLQGDIDTIAALAEAVDAAKAA